MFQTSQSRPIIITLTMNGNDGLFLPYSYNQNPPVIAYFCFKCLRFLRLWQDHLYVIVKRSIGECIVLVDVSLVLTKFLALLIRPRPLQPLLPHSTGCTHPSLPITMDKYGIQTQTNNPTNQRLKGPGSHDADA